VICQVCDFLKYLPKIAASANELQDIQRADLKGFEKLKVLNLQINSLNAIEDDVLRDLKDLEEIRLSKNKLWAILDTAFASQRKLREIHLDGNQIKDLQISVTLLNNPHINTIMMQKNDVISISPYAYARLKNISVVGFEGNPCGDDIKSCKKQCDSIKEELKGLKKDCQKRKAMTKAERKKLMYKMKLC
jgi:Leucine-rich repeat (LRR) protein